MAHVYVDSNAAGAGTGADWANAYTTLVAAFAGSAVAGNNFWVAQDHSESTAGAVTLTGPGTAASPCTVICVNKAGTVPPVSADLATTGIIASSGNNAVTISGINFWYGLTFNSGTGAVAAALNVGGQFIHMKRCKLARLGTNTGSITMGQTSGACKIVLDNTTIQFGHASDNIIPLSLWTWKNTPSAIAGATLPTTLIFPTAGTVSTFIGVDLSALGSGKTLSGGTAARGAKTLLLNCKLGGSVTVSSTPSAPGSNEAELINCDSADTNYRTEKYQYMGTQTVETTIVRTGGASDGTTSVAWKFVTTANSEWLLPFESIPITIWNETTTEQTLTIYGYQDAVAVPTNREIWMEVEYLGTSGFPQSTFVSSGAADYLAAAANYTEDTSSTWGGGDMTTRFKMSATFTAAEKGPITVRIYVAKASATMYIDPEPEISGLTVSRSHILAPGVYMNQTSANAAIGHGNMTGGMQ